MTMIAPNKQNYLVLQKRLKTFQNGHKLLQEKRNGLIVSFVDLAKKGKELEKKISSKMKKVIANYDESLTFVSSSKLFDAIEQVPATKLDVSMKRISGVKVKDLHIDVNVPKRDNLKPDLQESLNQMTQNLPALLELINLKTTVERLANEILKTNRQISAIENKVEDTEGQIKWVKSVLDEKSNLEKSVLITIFGN